MKSLRKQGIILFTILALVLVACGGDAAEEEVVEETTPEVVETLDSPAVTTAQSAKTGCGSNFRPMSRGCWIISNRCRPIKRLYLPRSHK